MELRYFVPFKAAEGVKAEDALREKLLNIEGVAIDTSVNANHWMVPNEDLDFVAAGLTGAQLRVDHAESALMVVGKVSKVMHVGEQVLFSAEVGEEKLIEKILRGYVNHVSIQLDSADVECSKCSKPTRREGMLIHLCPGAWEIIHKPLVRELSIVASPAYKDTAFSPVGFGAAMNAGQYSALMASVSGSQSFVTEGAGDDEGSNREVQGPDKQKMKAKEEVGHMSEHNGQSGASPLQAQSEVNTADPPSGSGNDQSYEQMMDQLTQLEKQIGKSGASQADMDAMKQKVADLEGEVAKKATKKSLSKKLSDLQKQLQEPDGDEGEEAEADACKAKRSGRGIVAADDMQEGAVGNGNGWFKDLLKAHKKLTGFQ